MGFGLTAAGGLGRRGDATPLVAQVVFSAFVALVVGLQALKASSLPDFAVFWAAQHVAHPYDYLELSRALGPKTTFFPYPPTFLLLTLPLAWVTMHAGYLAWVGLSAATLVASLRRLTAPLVLFVPAVFLAGINGQTSLIVAALLFTASTLNTRPILAGVLLGVVACIKPQVGLLIPIVLLAAGQWRTISAAMATLTLVGLATTVAYGPGIWSVWLGSLPAFVAANDTAWTGRYLALPGVWKPLALLVGALLCLLAGRRGMTEQGYFIAIAAALLGSLHAMDYDAAILAPFAVSAAFSNRWFGLAYAGALAFPPNALTVLAMLAFASWSLLQGSRLLQSFGLGVSKQNGNML